MVIYSSNLNSGSIGINITHSQETAVPCPYPINCRETALPFPRYHSDATGNEISKRSLLIYRHERTRIFPVKVLFYGK